MNSRFHKQRYPSEKVQILGLFTYRVPAKYNTKCKKWILYFCWECNIDHQITFRQTKKTHCVNLEFYITARKVRSENFFLNEQQWKKQFRALFLTSWELAGPLIPPGIRGLRLGWGGQDIFSPGLIICVQCCGSVTLCYGSGSAPFWHGSGYRYALLTNASGSDFGSCYFRQWPSRQEIIFLLITFL